MRRLAPILAVVAIIAAVDAHPAASYNNCGFYPRYDHSIVELRHISCAEAKRALLRLRGTRRTIPMICGRPRWIGGWWVENAGRSFSAVDNKYSKGRRSFHYLRGQNGGEHTMCPPPPGSDEAGI
jgi:hypothetical protein